MVIHYKYDVLVVMLMIILMYQNEQVDKKMGLKGLLPLYLYQRVLLGSMHQILQL